jgi:hypothetical protein
MEVPFVILSWAVPFGRLKEIETPMDARRLLHPNQYIRHEMTDPHLFRTPRQHDASYETVGKKARRNRHGRLETKSETTLNCSRRLSQK